MTQMQIDIKRENISRLKEQFPDKEMLNISDVSKFTGLSTRTVARKFPMYGNHITIATLAVLMAYGE